MDRDVAYASHAPSAAVPGAPPANGAAGGRPFVGRERELAELCAALDAARTGHGSLYLLTGEPGIGKTRLAAVLSDEARAAGARVAWGRCWEIGGAPAYWPWIQVLRTVSGSEGPLAETDPGGAEPEAARFRLFDSCATFLRAAASERPLLIVLDDLHAADVPSLLLCRFIARSLPDAPILVVGTVREADARASEAGDLVAELARDAQRMPIGGLAEREVGQLVAGVAGAPRERSFVREVHRVSEGNPLFVDEIVRLRLAEAAARPDTGFRIPARVTEAIERRLGPLDPEALDVLAVAAVAGRAFRRAELAALAGLPADAVNRAVEAALAADVLVPVARGADACRFAHGLIRDTLYGRLAPERRRELHRRLGEGLEELHAGAPEEHLAELARHFREAGDRERTLEYSRRAARIAISSLAWEQAADLYEQALEAGGEQLAALDRCDLLLELGHARTAAGRARPARESYMEAAEEAARSASPERLARAALGFGSGGSSWADGTVDEPLVSLLERALAAVGEERTPLRALLLARLSEALLYAVDVDRMRELSAEALALARETGDEHALMRALVARQLTILHPENLEERLALNTELMELAERTGARELALDAYAHRITHMLELGRRDEVERVAARFRAVADELRQPHGMWGATVTEAMLAVLDARFDDAERLAHEALTVGEGAVALASQMFGVQMAAIRYEQGRAAEVESAIRATIESYPLVASWRCALVAMLTAQGREAEANRELDRLAAEDPIPYESYEWLSTTSLLGDAVGNLGRRDYAERLYDRLLPWADRSAVVSLSINYLGSVSGSLGVMARALGRHDDAVRHLEDALDVHRRMASTCWITRTQGDLARTLLERGAPGDEERARSLLEEVLAAAEAHGLQRAGSLAQELLETSPHGVDGSHAALFVREGDFWSIGDPGRPVRLKHTKGLGYIARLLREPGVDHYAAELAAGGASPDGDAGELLDASAKAAYRERLGALREEIDEATARRDDERAARAGEEMEALGRELAAAVGLGGRDRRAASTAERARSSVTKAIRAAIRRIREHDPALAQHLDMTIATGTFCRYTPEERSPVDWRLG